ncbi:hypothetical protein BH23VER1_BH23VER1_27020 [soil metagenome]
MLQMGIDRYRSYDGKSLPFSRWEAEGAARAAIVAVHGLSGAASDFRAMGEGLPGSGIAVYAPELRGQGNDPEPKFRGDIRRSVDWQNDLLALSSLVSARHPGAPVIWYGESLGALIVLATAAERPPDGIVLASPVVSLKGARDLTAWKRFLIRVAIATRPGKRIALEELGDPADLTAQMTTDTTHASQMAQTPHYLREFTLRLLGQISSLVGRSGTLAQQITDTPVLVLYSPHDFFTSAEDVEAFFEKLATPDKRKIRFDRSYHLILHDVQSAEAVDEVRRFVEGVAAR